MFNWLKNISINQSKKNIREILDRLLQITTSVETDDEIEAIKGQVQKIQNELYFELNGTIPIQEIMEEFVCPILDSELPGMTKGAVLHVIKSYTVDWLSKGGDPNFVYMEPKLEDRVLNFDQNRN